MIWSYFDGTKPHLRTYQADFEEYNGMAQDAENIYSDQNRGNNDRNL